MNGEQQEKNLLQAIYDHPDDDGPRLVYADWLRDPAGGQSAAFNDEQKSLNRGRGEFIHVQCLLAKLPEDDPQRPELQEREAELLRDHQAVWEGPEFQDICKRNYITVEYRCGFPEMAEMATESFLKHADRLFELAPTIRDLTTYPYSVDEGKALADSPHLRGLRWLEVREALEFGDDVAVALARSPHLTRLSVLVLEGCDIGSKGVAALAGSSHLAGLSQLNMRRNRLQDAGVEVLAASLHLKGLLVLNLEYNQIGDAGVQALAESQYLGSRLWGLNLGGNDIGDDGVRYLVAQDSRLNMLTTLILRGNRIGDEGASLLAASSHLAGLDVLELVGNDIGPEGLQALTDSPHLSKLKWLDIRDRDDAGWRDLMMNLTIKRSDSPRGGR